MNEFRYDALLILTYGGPESPDGVHFVEVKTRTAPVLAPLEMQVNTTKRQRICNAALQYVHKKRLEGKEIFFDII